MRIRVKIRSIGSTPGRNFKSPIRRRFHWNPTKTSPYNDKTGAYVASTTRTKIGSYAGGALPLPSNFPIAPPGG